MPDRAIVVNTTPLISLAAANCLEALALLYQRVIVPFEVAEEIRAGGAHGLGVAELAGTPWLEVQSSNAVIPVTSRTRSTGVKLRSSRPRLKAASG